MASCMYDNPATMMREYWRDGELVWFCSSGILEQLDDYWSKVIFGNRPDRWQEGRIVGSAEAMEKPKE